MARTMKKLRELRQVPLIEEIVYRWLIRPRVEGDVPHFPWVRRSLLKRYPGRRGTILTMLVIWKPIGVASAETLETPLTGQRITSIDLMDVVAKHFELTRHHLLGTSRTRSISRPRHIAMYLTRALGRISLPDTARIFYRVDHTSVIYAEDVVARELEEDHEFGPHIATIIQDLFHHTSGRAIERWTE